MTRRNAQKVEVALALLRGAVNNGPRSRWTSDVRVARNLLWGALKGDLKRLRKVEVTDGGA